MNVTKKMENPVNQLLKHLPVILLLMISAVVSVMSSNFLTIGNFSNIFMQCSGIAFVALGSMIVLISGGMDFTSAEVVACGSVLGGLWYMSQGGNVLLLILGCIITGVIVGCMNGILIAYVKFPPFIATLAMQSIVHCVMLSFAEGNIIQLEGGIVEFLGKRRIFQIPVSFLILVGFAVILWFVMTHTKFGVYTYALGGNEQAIAYAGVNIKKYKLLVYVMAGFCYSMGTILIASRMAAIYSSVNSTLLLDGIAATVIGGTSVNGGKGTVFGTLVGAVIIAVIANALILLNVPSNMHDVVKGGIIIFALLIDVVVNRIKA